MIITLAYPFAVSGKNVRFFDTVGGRTKRNRPWLQNLTWADEDLFTGIPVEPRPINQIIKQRLIALRQNPKGGELDHWVISPRVAVELFIEGIITQADLRHIVAGDDYFCLPKTKLGKLVVQPDLPFDFAPSNVINTLLPC